MIPVFIDIDALLWLTEEEMNLKLSVNEEKTGVVAEAVKLTVAPDGYQARQQDGITLFLPEDEKVPKGSQINIKMKKSWFSRSFIAELDSAQQNPGFMGTRC